jgi:UDP-GlcNAc:undecaprenyl-phosphate GlcNAc-1-phosphate transferase
MFLPGAAIALAVTVVFMYALRPFAETVGLVDRPGGRKSHIGNVPVIGGIAMFIGMFTGMAVVDVPLYSISSLFLASLLLVVVGILDDRFHIPSAVRIVAQIAVVLLMVYGAGLALHQIGNPLGVGEISMGPVTLIFTTCVALTMINAYNLIDGADGLAGTLALITLSAISVVGGVGSASTSMALVASAAIVGYLFFNFPMGFNRSLRSFMGDAGSTFLGFTIVWITLGITQGPDRLISPVHCLWFAAIPIFDTLTCFVRRISAGKSPFQPGRDHFHHTLKNGGMTNRQVLAVLALLQSIYAMVALIGHFAAVPDFVMFAGWSALGLTQRFVIKYLATHHRALILRRRSRYALPKTSGSG